MWKFKANLYLPTVRTAVKCDKCGSNDTAKMPFFTFNSNHHIESTGGLEPRWDPTQACVPDTGRANFANLLYYINNTNLAIVIVSSLIKH